MAGEGTDEWTSSECPKPGLAQVNSPVRIHCLSLLLDQVIPISGIYPKEITFKNQKAKMFKMALSTKAPCGEQSKAQLLAERNRGLKEPRRGFCPETCSARTHTLNTKKHKAAHRTALPSADSQVEAPGSEGRDVDRVTITGHSCPALCHFPSGANPKKTRLSRAGCRTPGLVGLSPPG